MSRKVLIPLSSLLLTLLLLMGCGEDSESSSPKESVYLMETFQDEDELPDCNDDRDGFEAFVVSDSSERVCSDGEWNVVTAEVKVELECHTETLKDSSGNKVICNGDSVGVFLNGSDGKDGSDGDNGINGTKGTDGTNGEDASSCSVKKLDDITAAIICGKDTLSYPLIDTLAQTEDVVSGLTLNGTSQKGPFIRGTKVVVYEMNNGTALQQTSRKFVGQILSNDGKFSVYSVSLVSPYALIEADGFYQNEVTGKKSSSAITLFALTDLMEREKVNVNLLTHLVRYRVERLILKDGKNYASARTQAEKEVFAAFHYDNSTFKSPEDLDIFSKGEDNAALLAISVLLQGDRSEAELVNLLDDMGNDFADNGVWDDKKLRAEIALWGLAADTTRLVSVIRSNVESWNLGDVPEFEKYMSKFWTTELKMGECGSDDYPLGSVTFVQNEFAESLYAKTYNDVSHSKVRFICDDPVSPRWRVASDIERDTTGWKNDAGECSETGKFGNGVLLVGQVDTSLKYVCDHDGFRMTTDLENKVNLGCTDFNQEVYGLYKGYYKCETTGWTPTNDKLNVGSLKDERDGHVYKTIGVGTQMWMAENLNYDVQGYYYDASWCLDYDEEKCSKYGRFYTWASAVDSLGTFSTDCKDCGFEETYYDAHSYELIPMRGICPEGWRLPSRKEWSLFLDTWQGKFDEFIGVYPGYLSNNGYGKMEFKMFEDRQYFWVSDAPEERSGYCRAVKFETDLENQNMNTIVFWIIDNNFHTSEDILPSFGFSVRCLKVD